MGKTENPWLKTSTGSSD